MKLTDQFVIPGAEVVDGAPDVCALLVAGLGIRVLARYPGVRVLAEAEAGQGDQEDCNEVLHSFGWYVVTTIECCRFESRGRKATMVECWGYEVVLVSMTSIASNMLALFLLSLPSLYVSPSVLTLASSRHKEARRWYCVLTLATHG